MILNDSQKEMCIENMNLVRWIIRRKFSWCLLEYSDSYDDLEAQGFLGLVQASLSYDPDIGSKFSTYAVPYIIGFLSRYVREKLPLIRPPRQFLDIKSRVNKLRSLNFADDKICMELHISNKELMYVDYINSLSIVSLDSEVFDDDKSGTTFADYIEDRNNYYDDIENEDLLLSTLYSVLDDYKIKHKRSLQNSLIYEEWFLSRLYGFPETQSYLSKKYKVTQSYVSRIIKNFNNEFIKVFGSSIY